MSEAFQIDAPIRVLHLEDNPADHVLVREMLEREGLPATYLLVKNRGEFEAAVRQGGFDLIISDYSLPSYDGVRAVALATQWQKEVPFIFFSGTIGEETAVESLKIGATDYVVKQRPRRLVAVVRRALQEARDRSERKRAEVIVREQAALLDKAHDAIIVCDLADCVSYWNHSAERIYGWTAAEAMGRWLGELLTGHTTLALGQARKGITEAGEWKGELTEKTKSGCNVTIQSRWTLVRDDAGQPKAKMIFGTDITEQKLLEEKFLRTQRLESLGVLVGGIAHDLNNALSPILMGVGILEMTPLPKEVAGIVQTMKTSSLRGTEMVRQILTFARGNGGEKSTLQVNNLVREMGKIITDTFPKSIECQVQAGVEAAAVSGQAIQLHQVIMNLCINARDAMPKGGTLILTTSNVMVDAALAARHDQARPGPYFCLSVRDTGSGIPASQLPNIFQPFFTTKPLGQGTGLGLSTTEMIVKNHGGFMTVDSVVGQGSEFKVFLPALKTASPGKAAPSMAPLPLGRGEQILVVDDESAILALAQSTLEAYGYKVYIAASGPEAIAFFTQEHARISLVIVDQSMPYMDGATTIAALRKIKPTLKLISASGMDLRGADTERQTKADARIDKPFTAEKLLRTIHEVLTKK